MNLLGLVFAALISLSPWAFGMGDCGPGVSHEADPLSLTVDSSKIIHLWDICLPEAERIANEVAQEIAHRAPSLGEEEQVVATIQGFAGIYTYENPRGAFALGSALMRIHLPPMITQRLDAKSDIKLRLFAVHDPQSYGPDDQGSNFSYQRSIFQIRARKQASVEPPPVEAPAPHRRSWSWWPF